MGGSDITVKDKFPTYTSFFNWTLQKTNTHPPLLEMTFSDVPTSFRSNLTPCNQSCPCSECDANCFAVPGITIEFNSSLPTIIMFGQVSFEK